MDILVIAISTLLAAITLVFIFYPLWPKEMPHMATQQANQRLMDYQLRYNAALDHIRTVVLDHETGKISDDDYEILVRKAKLEAAQIRQKLDELLNQEAIPQDPAMESQVEALIAEAKATDPATFDETLRAEVAAEIAQLKALSAEEPEHVESPAATGEHCPHCGTAYQRGDAFCAACGHALAEQTQQASYCTACGHALKPDDAFCAGCGKALQPPAESETVSVSKSSARAYST